MPIEYIDKEKAKCQWCPFGRVGHRHLASSASHCDIRFGPEEACMNGACMAWEEDPENMSRGRCSILASNVRQADAAEGIDAHTAQIQARLQLILVELQQMNQGTG